MKKVDLYFNNGQPSGVDICDPEIDKPPRGPGWYHVGSYPYEVALDLVCLYRLIPFNVRKKMGKPEIGKDHWEERV